MDIVLAYTNVSSYLPAIEASVDVLVSRVSSSAKVVAVVIVIVILPSTSTPKSVARPVTNVTDLPLPSEPT